MNNGWGCSAGSLACSGSPTGCCSAGTTCYTTGCCPAGAGSNTNSACSGSVDFGSSGISGGGYSIDVTSATSSTASAALGIIIGGAVGGICVLGLLIAGIVLCLTRRRKQAGGIFIQGSSGATVATSNAVFVQPGEHMLPPPPPPPMEQGGGFCSGCGAQRQPAAKFCQGCGAKS